MCTQAAAEQQHLLQRCPSSQPPQEPTAVAHIQLGGSLRDAPTAKAPAAAASDGKVPPAQWQMLLCTQAGTETIACLLVSRTASSMLW